MNTGTPFLHALTREGVPLNAWFHKRRNAFGQRARQYHLPIRRAS
jgi:hypothetical protein